MFFSMIGPVNLSVGVAHPPDHAENRPFLAFWPVFGMVRELGDPEEFVTDGMLFAARHFCPSKVCNKGDASELEANAKSFFMLVPSSMMATSMVSDLVAIQSLLCNQTQSREQLSWSLEKAEVAKAARGPAHSASCLAIFCQSRLGKQVVKEASIAVES